MFAQRWEVGISGGVSYYVGDLNPTGHFHFPHPAASIFVKRNFGKHWSVRGGFTYAHVSADDSLGLFDYQPVRNLRFESDIFEVHAAVEFNFFPFIPGDDEYKKWTPYVFLGFGGYYFNPYVYYGGDKTPLQPIGTEGQGTPSSGNATRYSLFQPVMPFGMGVRWNFADRFTLGVEYGMRMLFTDYLDDVSNVYGINGEIVAYSGQVAADLADQSRGPWTLYSNDHYQRGIRTDKDWYGYLSITLSYTIKDPPQCYDGHRSFRKWRWGRR